LVVSTFAISTLLTPQPSSGTDGFGGQLEVKEIVWDGGIWNGEYLVTIANPTDRIIEASIYGHAHKIDENWQFVKCEESYNEESSVALITVFYPNSETELHTVKKEYLYFDSLKIFAVSGDECLLEKTFPVTKFVQFEVVAVTWGEMVNRSYEAETARWLSFTLLNYGEALNPSEQFTLHGYRDDNLGCTDKRSWNVQIGITSIKMRGDTQISYYKLYYDDKLLWEGNIT